MRKTPVNIIVYGGLFFKGDGIGGGKMVLNLIKPQLALLKI